MKVPNLFLFKEEWPDVPERLFAAADEAIDLSGWQAIPQIRPGVYICPACGEEVDFRNDIKGMYAVIDVFGGNTKGALKHHCGRAWISWRPVMKKFFVAQKKSLTRGKGPGIMPT
jgi:hypothetical protein